MSKGKKSKNGNKASGNRAGNNRSAGSRPSREKSVSKASADRKISAGSQKSTVSESRSSESKAVKKNSTNAGVSSAKISDNEYLGRDKAHSFLVLLPLVMFLAVIPLIVFVHSYDTGLNQYDWYTSATQGTDVFLYYKMIWIIVTSVYSIFVMLYLSFVKEEKFLWTKKMWLMAAYVLISFISAFTSINSHYSFSGIYEQFEPVWVLMSYGLMCWYAFCIAQNSRSVKAVMDFFTIGIAIMTFIGLSQSLCAPAITNFFKQHFHITLPFNDFFRTKLGGWFMTHSWDAGLQFNFELGRPYLTVYNPNYVGFYGALVIPLLVALIFADRKLWKKIVFGILAVSMFIIVFASQSRAGILAACFSIIIMVICMRKVFMRHIIPSVIGAVVIVGLFAFMNFASGNVIGTRMKAMFAHETDNYYLEDIVTGKDNVDLYYNGHQLKIYPGHSGDGKDTFELKDENGKDVPFNDDNGDGIYTVTGKNYKVDVNGQKTDVITFYPCHPSSDGSSTFEGFAVTISDGQVMMPDATNTNMIPFTYYFTDSMKEGGKGFYYYSGSGAMFRLKRHNSPKQRVPFFSSHYRFANMRGFMWARTIPLLGKYFILGSGPDTFIIAFPNDDIVGLNTSGHVNEIITKPHCMFLQVGVQTGVISLLALVILFIWYIGESIVILWKNRFENYISYVGAGIMASVTAYLIVALTNDSCTATAPIFYTLLGTGIGINHILRARAEKEKEKKKKEEKEKAEALKAGSDDKKTGSESPVKSENKSGKSKARA